MKHFFLFLLLLFSVTVYSQEQKMQWFADAKLGIFIHWGIYAVNGIDESWSFHNKKIPYGEYMKQLEGFTAENFHPEEWAELIKSCCARYAVITSKHHDGVALWNTRMNKLSVLQKTPARTDVLTPIINALRRNNIKAGIYFSLIDWSHPDYPAFLTDSARYDNTKDTVRWKRFLNFCHGQIREISEQFNPDLFWFDGDWEHSAEEWKAEGIRKMILDHNPGAIINGRLQGYGDYDTPEQNFPVSKPALKYWELCMTTNDSWGYQQRDTNYKTAYEIISIFADAISMGGNLLLDIGPEADGSVPAEQKYLLTEIGKWTTTNSEAIFNTVAGLPPGHFYGPTTLSKDSLTVYLFLPAKTSGDVMIKGLDSKIHTVSVVGGNTMLQHKVVGKISWSNVPGLVYIHVPENETKDYMTVLKVTLENTLKLYNGNGGLN